MNSLLNDPICNNLARVRERIARAEQAAGVPPGTVKLVGVTKTRPVQEIETAISAGLKDIGENRLQEALAKLPGLRLPVTRHFIGHLQRNKVRDCLGLFDMIQSVDSVRLAEAIDERAGNQGIRARVLIEVNTSGEESKFGVDEDSLKELVEFVAGSGNIELLGLMTVGPLTGDMARVAASFRALKKLFEKYASLKARNIRMEILSMGMSADFEIAIAEGANMIRVGTAIFGPRI